MRTTKQRQAILVFLRASRRHYTAAEVYEGVKQVIPNISLGTVYRNLGRLTEEGMILEIETEKQVSLYDGYTGEHAHFFCEVCGKTSDLDMPALPALYQGFRVCRKKISFFGVCPDCQRKK
ncbi:MAG: transcriptional repressor [Clostridia bacterium]|nr:transcriptional repressor [Clostridia bacterium]